MSATNNRIDRLQNTFSCPTSWETMSGTARKRYCTQCQKHVYDFSQLTPSEITALLAASRGNLCARITRHPDGSVQTQLPSQPALHLISRRASPLTSVVMSAALSLTPATVGTAYTQAPAIATVQTDQAAKKPAQPGEATASVHGTIVDSAGAIIAGAVVTLWNDKTGESLTRQSEENGEYVFGNLPADTYTVFAEMKGFKRAGQSQILLQAGEQKTIELRLELGTTITVGMMIEPSRPLRVLYEQSDLIVDATIGNSVVVSVEGETKWMKTALQINSQLKGANTRRVIDWYHAVYDEDEAEFKVGAQVLFFLNRRKEEKVGYELSDYRLGSKKLSIAEMQSYTSHIRELAALTSHRKATFDEIVEWLVQCAQDPATRWEGASDLLELQSTRQAQCEKDQASQPSQTKNEVGQLVQTLLTPLAADTNPAAVEKQEASLLTKELLTKEQKDRLTSTLLTIEKLSDKDRDLLQLVTTWETKRVIPFLVAQLHLIEMQPPLRADDLLSTLADLMDDEAIQKLAEEYIEKAEYADEEIQYEELTPEEKEELQEDALAHPIKRRQMLQNFLRVVEEKLRSTPRSTQ